ncbi:hypothetical protein IF188_10285 [Microbacterium sp. NEAU-LLC]|uniref:Endo-acting ulvan lyase C-terminal domain-containing protein n=1 Tax=Microbacterium helvum TaxID=2773713 RepID=A0ABR8NN73_9MICO|nr:hypothetical protein [Microbacterium helvum]MBD3942084.1 hypothetical protein [Microbacterium helvum]
MFLSETARPRLAIVLAEQWGAASLRRIAARIDPFADRHRTDPAWVLSRMAMFWRPGERYTHLHLSRERFAYGTGDAPVPTVRYPAMRIWNAHRNAPLAERLPYSADGAMRDDRGTIVPYSQTGHMVRTNNEEILGLAEEAAFLYRLTGEERYARFAADIYWQWLLGTFYVEPPRDLDESLGGPGGYEAGGIGGYYDFEVIHDRMGGQAAVVYDLLHDHLLSHPDPRVAVTGLSVTDLSMTVLRRFLDIAMVRGNRNGNWNVYTWQNVLPIVLVLDSDEHCAGGKGREHYLRLYLTASTPHHDALPEILAQFDPATGLWPESPHYAFGPVAALLDNAALLADAGIDEIEGSPTLYRAGMAQLPWIDARGNVVVFGDGRGGPPPYRIFEHLNRHAQSVGDTSGAVAASTILRHAEAAGLYLRSSLSYRELLAAAPLAAPTDGSEDAGRALRTAYSRFHRHIVQRSGNDPATALMATVYGGYPLQHHLTPSGLSAQLYGQGWAVGPQAKSYESYWSDDYVYSAGRAGANTVVPGYAHGEIAVNVLEPAVSAGEFTNTAAVSANHSIVDVTAAGHRRQLAIVRTSPSSGFVVDVFRADQDDADYLWHNLGDSVLVISRGALVDLAPTADLGARDSGYRFFTRSRKARVDESWRATWRVDRGIADDVALITDLWMTGVEGREVFAVDAPPTSRDGGVTPRGVNSGDRPTPTVIVRQTGRNAARSPFVAVFESAPERESRIAGVDDLGSADGFVALRVSSAGGRVDEVFSSIDDVSHEPVTGTRFAGRFGVASRDRDGFVSLYVAAGRTIVADGHGIELDATASACLECTADGYFRCSATADATLTIPVAADATELEVRQHRGDEWGAVQAARDGDAVTFRMDAGFAVKLWIGRPGARGEERRWTP